MVFGSMRLIMLDELYVGLQAQKGGSATDELFENVERPVGPPVQGVKSVGISLFLKGGCAVDELIENVEQSIAPPVQGVKFDNV